MRKLTILAVLAVAACGENAGWNPNYTMNSTQYGEYLREREVALRGEAPAPTAIPVKLPAKAPTAADIAGTAQTGQAAAATPAAAATGAADAPQLPANAQRATTGPYPGSTPVLVRYAHAENRNPGTTAYPRSNANANAASRACMTYANPAAAQTAFIAAGGPLVDARGMDPDGDGFVCGWDPRPYRQPQL
ncbi:hypothetical protein PE067_17820 [Paracoccus sp. DMF-8]|uniref:hypothetical protein n=1 Tax=Paracoccus sp. DMF-8 TaxID=3019445 RepID=UPI0023E36698|nr:hypothetical protein [Paracoccus sp. DMF-8]MDF3607834.1 hypothetical protein [Paracoccus sp. DMF-8]